MDTLQNGTEASKHYASQYSGPNGAVMVSRGEYNQALHALLITEAITGSKKHCRLELFVKRKLVSHISTLCSAIKPTLMKMRLREGLALVKELRHMLFNLRDMGYHELTATESEVAIAGLLKAWQNWTPEWAVKDAIFLAEKIIAQEMSNDRTVATYATVLLTKARISQLHVSDPELSKKLINYRHHVEQAVRYVYRHGLHAELNDWSTVARLASLVGATAYMHHAAKMDGRPDVLIKYGSVHLKVLAIWRARKT